MEKTGGHNDRIDILKLSQAKLKVKSSHSHFALGFCIATAMLIVGVRAYVARKLRQKRPGSVADLVRRSQLNSDRRDGDISQISSWISLNCPISQFRIKTPVKGYLCKHPQVKDK